MIKIKDIFKNTKMNFVVGFTIATLLSLILATTAIGATTSAVFKDSIIRGSIAIQKVDGDTKTATTQGDSTLAGAEFSVVNKSNNPVYVDGVIYQPNSLIRVLKTNASGACSIENLPYGTYEVYESRAPEGYLINSNHFTIRIRENGKTYPVNGTTPNVEEYVMRGDVDLSKYDYDFQTNKFGAQGDGTLYNTKVAIYNTSAGNIVWNNKTIGPGEIIDTISSDAQGKFIIKDLPYGRYLAREVLPPEGYNNNDAWEKTVKVG